MPPCRGSHRVLRGGVQPSRGVVRPALPHLTIRRGGAGSSRGVHVKIMYPSITSSSPLTPPPFYNTTSPLPTSQATNKRTLPQVAKPPAKRVDAGPTNLITEELGNLIRRDVELLRREGWPALVKSRRSRGDFASLNHVEHPARRLLMMYKHRGVPVKVSTPPLVKRALPRRHQARPPQVV